MVSEETIYEFDKEKYPNFHKDKPSLKYHDATFQGQYADLPTAIYKIKGRNKQLKHLKIMLIKLNGQQYTLYQR